ncbi:MAG: hypothetical protein ACK40X_06350, partial [Armatimonadota bacterium]
CVANFPSCSPSGVVANQANESIHITRERSDLLRFEKLLSTGSFHRISVKCKPCIAQTIFRLAEFRPFGN